jgi:hypothetical protein
MYQSGNAFRGGIICKQKNHYVRWSISLRLQSGFCLQVSQLVVKSPKRLC